MLGVKLYVVNIFFTLSLQICTTIKNLHVLEAKVQNVLMWWLIANQLGIGNAAEDIVEKTLTKGLAVNTSFPIPLGNPAGHAHQIPSSY